MYALGQIGYSVANVVLTKKQIRLPTTGFILTVTDSNFGW